MVKKVGADGFCCKKCGRFASTALPSSSTTQYGQWKVGDAKSELVEVAIEAEPEWTMVPKKRSVRRVES